MNLKMLPAALFAHKAMPQNTIQTGADSTPQNTTRTRLISQQEPLQTQVLQSQTSSLTINTTCSYCICTVADLPYLIKILSLYRSLDKMTSDFMLYVCCTDDESFRVLQSLNLPRCTSLTLGELGDGELYTLKKHRTASEFCWTLKSYLMTYLLEAKGLPHVLYCDGDIGFMDDPALLYQDWGDSTIYLCSQRDIAWVERIYGKYQAGVLGVKNNDTGLRMLHWWKSKCREWCYRYVDNDRMGDQKYLDQVPGLFGDVKISTHKGIDAAPWNTVYNNNCSVLAQGSRVSIDSDPLIAYHFACINIYDEQHFDLWHLGSINIQPVVRNAIYVPYLRLLREAISDVKPLLSDKRRLFETTSFSRAKTPFIYSEKNLALDKWSGKYAFCTISSRTYVARTLALYSSIHRCLSNFHLWICCADDTAYTILSRFKLENTTLLPVKDVETADILQSRPSKTIAEYCWTLKPALCSYVLEHFNVNRLLYCDSDIYFFSHPRPIYELWRDYTTLLNRQLGTPELENKHGMYQAGIIGFSKAAESLEILNWWQRQCTQWCYDDYSDPDRWRDQKYLQRIPDLFTSIRINDRYGLVAAPWNIVMNNIRGLQVNQSGSDIYLGSEKLTAYHFGGINVMNENTFDLWKHEPLRFDQSVIDHIYTPYLMQLRAIYDAIRAKGFDTASLFTNGENVQNPHRLNESQEISHGNVMFG